MIRWEEVKGLITYEVIGNPFLGIIPLDLETILARQSSIKRIFMRMGKVMSPAPFAIPQGGLPLTVEEALAKIQRIKRVFPTP